MSRQELLDRLRMIKMMRTIRHFPAYHAAITEAIRELSKDD